MPVKLEDRPIEQVREETIDKLIMNYSHGIISAEAFERRLDDATGTDSHQLLVELVADLRLEADTRYDDLKERRFTPNYRAQSEGSGSDRIVSVLSSNDRSGQWVVPQQLNMIGVLGSATLDFTDAVLSISM